MPSSKKLSWMPMPSRSSSSAAIAASRCSAGVCGRACSRDDVASSFSAGAGSAERSTLPLEESGSACDGDHPRRDHGLGQAIPQPAAEVGRRERVGSGRDEVTREPLLAACAFPRDDHRLLDGRVERHRGLDLGELDAHAADLHLVVGPAQQLEHPPVTPPCPIAGRIHPPARRPVRVGEESPGRPRRVADVAPRHPGAADVQLAHHARRYRVEPAIQHVGADTRQRPADRRRRVDGRQALVVGGWIEASAVDGRLGQSVGVDHAGAGRQQASQAPEQSRAHVVRAHGQQAQGQRLGAGQALEVLGQGLRDGRDQLEAVDLLGPDQPCKASRVEQDVPRAGDQGAARRQRPDPVAREDVEGERRGLEVPSRRTPQIVERLPGGRDGQQGAVVDHDALGPARGARGGDDVGQVVAVDRHAGIPRILERLTVGLRMRGRPLCHPAEHSPSATAITVPFSPPGRRCPKGG